MPIIGDYEVGAELGQGPLGKVYVAAQIQTQQKVVFRGFMKPHDADDEHWEAAIQRYAEELTMAQRLSHPNIAQIYQFGQLEEIYWVASEYFEGLTMTRILDRQGPQTPEWVQSVLEQVSMALDYAAREGAVHTDLTPYNVLRLEDGQIKVINFGLGHIRDKWGSPYLSPEQVRGEPADLRSDLFALGSLTFELLAGDPPFFRGDADATAAAILSDDLPPLPKYPRIERFLHKMLAKEKEDRFQSALEAASEFARAIEQTPQADTGPQRKGPLRSFHPTPSLSQYNLSQSDVRSAIQELRAKLTSQKH